MESLNGINFEPLVYDENNLTKVRLIGDEDNTEGIWVVVSPETKAMIDKDGSNEPFVAMLANNALNFAPNHSWGMHIYCKTDGENRPIARLDWVDYDNEKNRIWSDDVKEEHKW